jgi:DNA-binding transcriptional LysR family regulator
MSHINAVDTARMSLAGLDLNLLLSLDALLQQRSVTRAAEQMGLSQPALSASLARLRRHFGDELLVRVGNQYRLTPLAVRLKDGTGAALAGVERVFGAQPEFDPALTTREFSLVVADDALAVLGAGLARLLAAEAPGARLRLATGTPRRLDRAERLLLGADLLVAPHGGGTDLPHQDLYRDDWVCVVATGNPDVGDALDARRLGELPWVVRCHGTTAAAPEVRALRMLGVEPDVRVVTETAASVPALVAGTSRVAMLPRRLAGVLPPDAGVRTLPCPLDTGELVTAMWWHPAQEPDPAHHWFRNLLTRAAAAEEAA